MIYFIQDALLNIKIGFSETVDARVRTHQTSNSAKLTTLLVMDGGREMEGALHDRFAGYRVAGEWFKPGPEIIEFIAAEKERQAIAFFHRQRIAEKKRMTWPLKIYLAGKIYPHCWRHDIVAGLEGHDDWTPIEKAIGGVHTYVGPFFTYQGHGIDFAHHGRAVGADAEASDGHMVEHDQQVAVVQKCLTAISTADIVASWIDCHDCYGTIVELGYAKALGKKVFVTGPREFRDMWFLYRMADDWAFSPMGTEPKKGLERLLNWRISQDYLKQSSESGGQ